MTKPYGVYRNWQYGGNIRMANSANCGGKELKYFDSVISTVSTELNAANWFALRSTGSTIYQGANLVPNGAGQSQRIGRAIQIHRLQCLGKVNYKPAIVSGGVAFAANDAVSWKWVWYLDRQVNGTATTDALSRLVYKNVSGQDPQNFFIDPTYKDRYSIIKVKKGTFNPQVAVWDGSAIQGMSGQRVVKFFKNFKEPIEIIYNITSQDPLPITEVLSNNINTIIALNVSEGIEVSGNVRIWYTD